MESDSGQIQIGVTLRDARRRNGIEVREVEERTKIRARYIRALESESWDVLPSPAYVRGFLRTYGQVLGLDGEMLVDLYRRGLEQEVIAAGGPAPGEPVLSERRSAGSQPGGPPRGLLVLGGVAAVVVLLVILGLALGDGDGDDEGPGDAEATQQEQRQAEQRQERREERQRERRREERQAAQESAKVNATLTALTAVEVCLVAGADSALIDNQTLSVDARERFQGNERYLLSFGPGEVRFKVGDAAKTLEVAEPTSYRGDSEGIREVAYRGPDCP